MFYKIFKTSLTIQKQEYDVPKEQFIHELQTISQFLFVSIFSTSNSKDVKFLTIFIYTSNLPP